MLFWVVLPGTYGAPRLEYGEELLEGVAGECDGARRSWRGRWERKSEDWTRGDEDGVDVVRKRHGGRGSSLNKLLSLARIIKCAPGPAFSLLLLSAMSQVPPNAPLPADSEEAATDTNTPVPYTSPLPVVQLAVLCAVRLMDPVTFTQIFPYINQFLTRLHLVEDQSQIGFYSGLVVRSSSLPYLHTSSA